MVTDLQPGAQFLHFLRTFFSQLGSRHNRKPVLYIGGLCAGLFAEELQVVLCHALVIQGQDQVGPGNIRRCISLGGMDPVDDMVSSGLVQDDIGGLCILSFSCSSTGT